MGEILKENKEIDYTKEWLDELKNSVIDQKLNTLDTPKSVADILNLLENKSDWTKTSMYKKLEQLEWEDFNIEKFAKNIDYTIKKFLYQSFLDKNWDIKLNDNVVDSISVWIQFAMMETLTNVWEKGSDFFNSFSDLKVKESGSFLKWLLNVFGPDKWIFGKIWKVNKFYVLANRFQNCVNYISNHSWIWKEFGDWSKISEFTNGNKFRKLLDNEIRDTSEWLMSKSPIDVWISVSGEWTHEMSEWDKLELQSIADNVNMPIDRKTIKAIEKAIPTAQTLLTKRISYKDNISWLVDKIWDMLNVNVFWLWTLWSLLGLRNPADFLRSKEWEKKWILDFILIWIWFEWWMKWLHREYVRKNIDENLDSGAKKVLISDMYKYYNKEKETEYIWTNTINKFAMSKMDETLKNKIPVQYDILKMSLSENLVWNENKISPSILVKYWFKKENFKQEKFIDNNWKEKTKLVIDENKFDKSKVDDKFIDKYLADNIKSFASDLDFMENISNPDQFVLALMWNLVAGNWFVEWVVIWEETIDNYLVEEEKEQSKKKVESDWEIEFTWWDLEIIGKIETELKKYNSPIKADDVLNTSKQYSVPVEYIMAFMKNDSTYATAWKWARTNNPWNIWNDDIGNEKNYNNLKDWMNALWKHLRWRIDEYQKVYWFVVIPTAKELADNIWYDGKWFLSNQENYKKPNPERKWAYMSMKTGGNTVDKFAEDLADFGITNYNKVA